MDFALDASRQRSELTGEPNGRHGTYVRVVQAGIDTQSDTELWELSRFDDAEAFALLFERHAKHVYNYCFRATGRWETAEDLLSLTFLEAWRRRGKALPEGAVLPWLYGIATNVIRNTHRSERRFAAAMKRVPVGPPEPDFADSSDTRLDDEQRMTEANELLGQLASHEREVFLLCACMEVTYEDAALALSVPIGTIRSRLARARARLRELESACGHIRGGDPTCRGGVNDEDRKPDSTAS